MMEQITPELLHTWNQYATYATYVAFTIAIGIALVYVSRLIFAKDYKHQYDIVSLHEIHYLWRISLSCLVGGALYIAAAAQEATWLSLLLRMAIATGTAFGIGYVLRYVLKFYYPFFIEKRLHRLRYKPRISPQGRKMKLLSEEEEDLYLDEGMQAEENVSSVDYDVWVEENSGYVKIEKYYGKLHANKCPECQYYTMRIEKEEITQTPTQKEQGTLTKHSRCSYCAHQLQQHFKLASLGKQKKRENLMTP